MPINISRGGIVWRIHMPTLVDMIPHLMVRLTQRHVCMLYYSGV